MVRSKVTQKRYYESGSEEESEDEVAARPPAKKKGRGSMTQKLSQPKKIIYKDDISDDSPSEPEEVDDDSDFGAPKKSPKKKAPTPKKSKKVVSKKKTPVKPAIKKSPAKKTPAKKTPAKKTPVKSGKKATNGTSGRHSGRQTARKSYSYSSDEDQDEDEEDSEQESAESEQESDSDIEEVYVKPRGKKGKKGAAKKTPKKLPKKNVAAKKVKKPSHPPIDEMFTTAIKRLRDNPRKGSSMAAIKGFMAEEWGLIIPEYASKIKKYIVGAVASGEVIQTKGKGASGRFTVPGLKMKKKRRKNKLTKKWDEDEPEYVVKKTARDDEREKAEEEIELKRQQRMEEAVRKELEKANRPKKPSAPRKTEWEVEMIKGVKVTEEETYYKVKWFGASKMTWEPEENLRGCRDAIENFEIEEKTRIREEERRKKEMEENGTYEVSKILDVQFEGDKREFLVRWKYCKPSDDTWEPEDNLGGSEDMIERFMDRYNQTHGEHVSEKTLREGPKQIERLNYTMKDIKGKSRKKAGWNGTRMTYYGMDDSDDE